MNNPRYVKKEFYISSKENESYKKNDNIVKYTINHFLISMIRNPETAKCLILDSKECVTIMTLLAYGVLEENIWIIHWHDDILNDDIKKKYPKVNIHSGDARKSISDINIKFDFMWLDWNNTYNTTQIALVEVFRKKMIKYNGILAITFARRNMIGTDDDHLNDLKITANTYGYNLNQIKKFDKEIKESVYTVVYQVTETESDFIPLQVWSPDEFIACKNPINFHEVIDLVKNNSDDTFNEYKTFKTLRDIFPNMLINTPFNFKTSTHRKGFLTKCGIKTEKIKRKTYQKKKYNQIKKSSRVRTNVDHGFVFNTTKIDFRQFRK